MMLSQQIQELIEFMLSVIITLSSSWAGCLYIIFTHVHLCIPISTFLPVSPLPPSPHSLEIILCSFWHCVIYPSSEASRVPIFFYWNSQHDVELFLLQNSSVVHNCSIYGLPQIKDFILSPLERPCHSRQNSWSQVNQEIRYSVKPDTKLKLTYETTLESVESCSVPMPTVWLSLEEPWCSGLLCKEHVQ